jgi:hypothetical protein
MPRRPPDVPVKLAARSIKRDPATKVVTGVQVRPHVQHKSCPQLGKHRVHLECPVLTSDWSNVNINTQATSPLYGMRT